MLVLVLLLRLRLFLFRLVLPLVLAGLTAAAVCQALPSPGAATPQHSQQHLNIEVRSASPPPMASPTAGGRSMTRSTVATSVDDPFVLPWESTGDIWRVHDA